MLALVIPPLNECYAKQVQKPVNVDDGVYIRAVKLFLLHKFHKPEHAILSLEDLREKGKNIKIEYTLDEIQFIESITQTVNWYWHRFRVVRVTATTFKKICRTSIIKPAMSYVRQICWPEKTTFTSVATEYGKRNEPLAIQRFCNEMNASHQNFKYRKSGIVINNNYPFFSATPDGIIECDCCGVIHLK